MKLDKIFTDTKILFIIYSMFLVLQLILVSIESSFLGWFCVGFALGLLFVVPAYNSLMCRNRKLMNDIFEHWNKEIKSNVLLTTEINMLKENIKKKVK